YNFGMRLAGPNSGEYLKASQPRHPNVKKCKIKASSLDIPQRLCPVLHGSHSIPGSLQHARDSKTGCAVVVRDKNICQCLHGAHGGCPARRDPMIDIASKCYVEERNRSTHVLAPTDTNQRVARFPALYQNECLDRTLIFPYRWKRDRA